MSNIPTPSEIGFPGSSSVPSIALTPDQQYVVDLAWLKLDDTFDSLAGGPWLTEQSRNSFNEAKTSLLFPYALARINYTNPLTSFNATNFPYTGDAMILAQSLVLETILHLMRSYVEQPSPSGSGNVTWLDRRNYIDRWKQIYDLEEAEFKDLLRIFKRKYLGLGHGKGIIDTKQGRMVPVPMRTRYPRGMGYR